MELNQEHGREEITEEQGKREEFNREGCNEYGVLPMQNLRGN